MLEDNRSPLEHPLHLKTPLLWSPELSEKSGLNIWLKLENTQSTASYKIRGIGHMLQNAVKNGCKHIISSSGGNAGMASAYAAKIMGVPCTVIVPVTTAPFMIEKIKHIATNVEVLVSPGTRPMAERWRWLSSQALSWHIHSTTLIFGRDTPL